MNLMVSFNRTKAREETSGLKRETRAYIKAMASNGR